ncbi:uncharacterized protein BDZ83DRAFT_732862 [Colletotrichum acutatum]|uniref:Uncharacterized protein n=1 Tax=Glomerella acutata TaxID=27357 RepID=A0AAD8UIE5_GLOAC|nr:uncharacterized protein BDZ83DRAFT_732862 [Colletotrichum acutatum]KAK1721310.1 hypothetical protein BDZ83DRAFT_732862 [Colletotrichum acutatum]
MQKKRRGRWDSNPQPSDDLLLVKVGRSDQIELRKQPLLDDDSRSHWGLGIVCCRLVEPSNGSVPVKSVGREAGVFVRSAVDSSLQVTPEFGLFVNQSRCSEQGESGKLLARLLVGWKSSLAGACRTLASMSLGAKPGHQQQPLGSIAQWPRVRIAVGPYIAFCYLLQIDGGQKTGSGEFAMFLCVRLRKWDSLRMHFGVVVHLELS